MIPSGHIILVISRGDKIIFEKEGIFNIWSYVKDGELMAAVRDAIEDKVIFEDLPCIAVSVNDPYVQILTEED
ncbi:MAG: hypothetical protein HXN04_06515 [Porphyromonadaceae bacterium]|nr:hypothetical protein [Porphyromonadaceae bacterium]